MDSLARGRQAAADTMQSSEKMIFFRNTIKLRLWGGISKMYRVNFETMVRKTIRGDRSLCRERNRFFLY
jgi:hypothetical protein